MNVFYDKILDYKRGLLSDEESKDFELAIRKDPELQSAVENADILEMLGDAAFEKETKALIEKALSTTKENSFSKYRVWFMLIVALVLVLAAILKFTNNQTYSPSRELIAAVMVDYTLPQVLDDRGVNEKSTSLLLAKEAFSKREFEEAETILVSSEFQDGEWDDVHFLLAHIYFVNEEYDLSEKELNKVEFKDTQPLQDLLNRLKKKS